MPDAHAHSLLAVVLALAEALRCHPGSPLCSAATAPLHGARAGGEVAVRQGWAERGRHLRGWRRGIQGAPVPRHGRRDLGSGAPRRARRCYGRCLIRLSRRLQFEITDDSEAVQMLQRSTQVGEFYVMVRAARPGDA